MIHPTKIHLAISNRTGTAQSSPHFLAIVVVHFWSATGRFNKGKKRERDSHVQMKSWSPQRKYLIHRP
jgi:hypothetical protein